jgi:hypothetical protein
MIVQKSSPLHFPFRRHPFAVAALLAAALFLPASQLHAQKVTATPGGTSTIDFPDGAKLTTDPATGQIVVQLPKTGTTTTVDTKNGTTSSKDNGTGKSSGPVKHNPPPKAPGKSSTGKGPKVTVTPNDDGSITVTIANNGETETITVKPEKDPQTGQTTTTVTTPADPQSSGSVTTDKDNNVTNTSVTTPAPGGQSFVVTKGPDGLTHIYSKNGKGEIVSDQPVGDNNTVEIGEDKIPHIVPKPPQPVPPPGNPPAPGAGETGTPPAGETPPPAGETPAPTTPTTPPSETPASPPANPSHHGHGGKNSGGTSNQSGGGAMTTPGSTSSATETPILPAGVVFATAPVQPDEQIQVDQPGYAVIASAGVDSVKPVKPGDKFDASSIVSLVFDDGTGLVVNGLKETPPPICATVGSTDLLSDTATDPLPVNGGDVTMYVESTQPFATPAISTGTVTKTPDITYAEVLDKNGDKVGQLSDYSGLSSETSGNVKVITEDSSGATLKESDVKGGEIDGTPSASFNLSNYKPGQKGVLELGNQSNYRKMISMTRFGDATNLADEPITLVPLSDVKGLPAECPFDTRKLSFVALHTGEARVAVYFPRAVPPKPVANPGDDEMLKKSNAQFQDWLAKFAR